MVGLYEEFLSYLKMEDKERCINFALDKLSRGELGVVTLYTEVIGPALNNIVCHNDVDNLCVWREHTRSSIVRTIIECCYPYVIRERDEGIGIKIKGKVVVLCPEGEHHELGARMVNDFFTLGGYSATFVGANVPREEFLDISHVINPDYIAISVTNYYNIVSAKKTIERIRAFNPRVKILVGGNAFLGNPNSYKDIGADMLLNTYQDIVKLTRGED